MPLNVSLCFGLFLLCFELCGSYVMTDSQGAIETECRDRHFWVSVGVAFADPVPQFEAVVENGVHIISENHASMCGYTLNHLNGRTSLRASYFSCHTRNQNDNNFLFKLNVVFTDNMGKVNKYPISETCMLPADWSAKEVLCEENYMEVTVARDTPCTSDKRTSNDAWLAALAFAQQSAISEWQLMFLNPERLDAMSVSDAGRMGYMVDSTPNRVVFRSAYTQPHTTISETEGIVVAVIHATVFFRQMWAVVLLDTSAACTIAPGFFDGITLHWRTPKIMRPLVQEPSGFVSKSMELGVDARLLDESTRTAMGFSLVDEGQVVRVSVPFGAPGGHRTSFVENNVYKESYLASLCYEHIFSHVFVDGTEIETRHRQLRVIETPLISRIPFAIDETLPHEEVFSVYLGNLALDVQLTALTLNENYHSVTDAIQQHYSIMNIPHINGTYGFIIKVPFEDKTVNKVYLGEGVLQYSVGINYTLNLIGRNNTFFHYVSVVAHVYNVFPPDVTAFCTEKSIIFRIDHPRPAGLWEVCVGNQALTSDLSRLRGYILKNDRHSLTLELPLFTSGYTYEEITLRNFVGTFEVLLRDSKTLEIHKRTTKSCYFETGELTVCSTDGLVTVVATTTQTWPTVSPSRTSLLDRRCRPTATDKTRVMFSFGVTTCGTRLMIGNGYIVYENEVVSDDGIVTDQESSISRESKFSLTVRCFYPLDSVKKIFTSRLFDIPGFDTGKVIDTTGVKEPHGNVSSSQTASVFEPKPCSDSSKRTLFQQKGLPHPTNHSANQGRKTSEHSYRVSNVPYPYPYINIQHFKDSTSRFTPQMAIKHNSDSSKIHLGQQKVFDGLFEDKNSFLQKNAVHTTSMKRSGQNQDNSVMGDDSSALNSYKGSEYASHTVHKVMPSYLQPLTVTGNPTNFNPIRNEETDQLYQRKYISHYPPNSGFQHPADQFNRLIDNLPSKDSFVIFNIPHSSRSGLGQKLLESYTPPPFNVKSKHKLTTVSRVEPFKEYERKNEGFLHIKGKHKSFVDEDNGYNPKKIPFMRTQQQKEAKESSSELSAVKPSYGKVKRTLFFPGRSRYGISIHKGIIRG